MILANCEFVWIPWAFSVHVWYAYKKNPFALLQHCSYSLLNHTYGSTPIRCLSDIDGGMIKQQGGRQLDLQSSGIMSTQAKEQGAEDD